MVLVEAIMADHYSEPPTKIRKLDTEDMLNTHWTVGDSSQMAVTANFMLAYQCWQLLYSCDYLERGVLFRFFKYKAHTWSSFSRLALVVQHKL